MRTGDAVIEKCYNHEENSEECGANNELCCRNNISKYDKCKKLKCTKFKTFNKCGQRNEKILEGQNPPSVPNAHYGEHPYMIAIFQIFEEDETDAKVYEFRCGGSLIHPKVALTAAHCLGMLSADDLMARAGELRLNDTYESCPHEDRTVYDIATHDQYSKANHNNNIALLILHEEFQMSALINTICLPEQNHEHDLEKKNKNIGIGWRSNEKEVIKNLRKKNKNNNASDHLEKVFLTIGSHEKCQENIRDLTGNSEYNLNENFFCTRKK